MSHHVLLALALLSTPLALDGAMADHNGEPGGHGDCSGDIIQVGLGDATPFGTLYYVVVGDTPDQAWGYIETNEERGLQRGGTDGHFGTDPCQESENPDFYWY